MHAHIAHFDVQGCSVHGTWRIITLQTTSDVLVCARIIAHLVLFDAEGPAGVCTAGVGGRGRLSTPAHSSTQLQLRHGSLQVDKAN